MLFSKGTINIDESWLPGDLENARIYLASPYTHESEGVREIRYLAALEALHFFLKHRLTIYSPIVHSHAAAAMGGLPIDFNFWGTHCLSFLENWATDIWVLQLPGIKESVGVRAEVEFCAKLTRPVNHRAVYFPRDVPLPR